MDTALLKKEITDKVNQIEDPTTLQNLEVIVNGLLEQSQSDFWNDLNEVKKSIEEAEKELGEGNGIPHEQVMKNVKKRYNL